MVPRNRVWPLLRYLFAGSHLADGNGGTVAGFPATPPGAIARTGDRFPDMQKLWIRDSARLCNI